MSDRIYSDADFAAPSAICDLVMKGGITSGAVYPLALTALSTKYRFANIGGTSAGAIAAAAAAAAEYARPAGFTRLQQVPQELGSILFKLFQPSPSVAPLFAILVAALRAKSAAGKYLAVIWAALTAFWPSTIITLVLTAVIALLMWNFGAVSWGAALFVFLLLLLIGLVIGVICQLLWMLGPGLTNNNYGLCPCIRQVGYKDPALTDWLADTIDEIAGRKAGEDPLTFGDLMKPRGDRPPITLRMMTTNLTMSRPYMLPLETQIYKFKWKDFEALFPGRIMSYLKRVCKPYTPEGGESGEFYEFPTAENLPVVVAARMSLSFPILICAVPLIPKTGR